MQDVWKKHLVKLIMSTKGLNWCLVDDHSLENNMKIITFNF